MMSRWSKAKVTVNFPLYILYALDTRTGTHVGIYMKHLLTHIKKRELDIENVFKHVQADFQELYCLYLMCIYIWILYLWKSFVKEHNDQLCFVLFVFF